MYFNCTIQELKHELNAITEQQRLYFNCTIQELKLVLVKSYGLVANYFNCTIQELKLSASTCCTSAKLRFQLHHTGIKTRRFG